MSQVNLHFYLYINNNYNKEYKIVILNNRVCDEFEKIKERALKKPDTTQELNETAKFIDQAKSTGIVQLGQKIRELQRSMAYLLDTHLFAQEDIDLNTRVLLWPHEIGPIFDFNEEVINYQIINLSLSIFSDSDI